MTDLRIQNKDTEVNSLHACTLPLLNGRLWPQGHRGQSELPPYLALLGLVTD